MAHESYGAAQGVRLPRSFALCALSAALLLIVTTMVLLRSITVIRSSCVVGTIAGQAPSPPATMVHVLDILTPGGAPQPTGDGTVIRLETPDKGLLEGITGSVTKTDERQRVFQWRVSLSQPVPRASLTTGRVSIMYESSATGLLVAAESLMRIFRASGQRAAKCL